ncbi:MAG: hypothetical protein RL557_696 [archaeon]|jgi:predicted nucleic acid-binding protein
MKKKYLIFDAGPLINFSMNGLIDILEKLQKEFKGEFLITKEVKEEIIDNPIIIKKFELEALRLETLFKKGTIKHADLAKAEVEELRVIRDKLLQIANSMFKSRKGPIHLLDKGEAAALALSVILERKLKESIPLVIDERTARMLCENPDNLKKIFEKKFRGPVYADRRSYQEFENFKVIRSTELMYIAYKKKLFDSKDKRMLDALLYALKFHGCSITDDEISEIKAIAG